MSNSGSEEETEVNIWSWTPAFNPNAPALFRTKSEDPLSFFVYDDLVSKQRLEKIIRNYGGSVCCDIVETHSIILVNENAKPPDFWGPCFSRKFIRDCIEIFELLELSNYVIPGCVAPQCQGSLSSALFDEKFVFRPVPIPTSYSNVMKTIENPPDDNPIENLSDNNLIRSPVVDNPIENPPNDNPIENLSDNNLIRNLNVDNPIDSNVMVPLNCKKDVLDPESPCDVSDYKITNKPHKLTLKYKDKDKSPLTIYGYFSKCNSEFLVLEHVDITVSSKEVDGGIVVNNCLTAARKDGGVSEANVKRKSDSASGSGSSDNFQDATEELLPDCRGITDEVGVSDSFNSLSDGGRGIIPYKEKAQQDENAQNSSISTNLITDNGMLQQNECLACAPGSNIPLQVSNKENDAGQVIQPTPESVPKIKSLPSVIVTPAQEATSVEPSTSGINNKISYGKRQVSPKNNEVLSKNSDTCYESPQWKSKRSKVNHTVLSVPDDTVNRVPSTGSKSNVINPRLDPTDKRVQDFPVAGPSKENQVDENLLLAPFFGVKKGKVTRPLLTPTDLIDQEEPLAHSTPQCTREQEDQRSLLVSRLPQLSEVDSDEEIPDLKNWPNAKKYGIPDKHTRMKYSRKEKADIIKYIVAKRAYGRLKSDALYREMEARQICPHRTYQSMKNHFLKTLLNELDSFDFLSDNAKRKLRGEVW